ncbi:hypothetical protein [Streptomyces sp. NPDC048361]|uniref:hypothetical protein n=1 Tax=Streptomyces sp. NPDC048361 TaxID=3154720 RepID=UPI003423DB7E
MLTYQDVVIAPIGVLIDVAQVWDDMADMFKEPQSWYESQVQAVANNGAWVGVSAGTASARFALTRKQFADAQVEARAIASILQDAHVQFVRLVGHVKDLVDQAQRAGMHVDSQGWATYDTGKLSPYRTDYDETVKKGNAAAGEWTKSIADAVRAVDDADQGVRLALHEAAGINLAPLRDSMATAMSNHGHEVYSTRSVANEDNAPLNQHEVMEITKQVSRSEHSYGMLTEGMHSSIVDGFYDSSRKPEDTLSSAGYTVGFMERARYLALKGDQHDFTWDKTWSYHALGAPITLIPGVGDAAQRGVDAVTTAWIMDEQHRQAEKLTGDSQATYDHRRGELNALADQWYTINSSWADGHPGYSAHAGDGVYKQIAGWANDGNYQASGLAGAQ